MTDAVAKSDELDKKILAISADKVFTKRTVVQGFVVVIVILLAMSVGGFLALRSITSGTNKAVTRQIPGLERGIEERDDVINQATDAIVLLSQILIDNGITPPEIVIRPPED